MFTYVLKCNCGSPLWHPSGIRSSKRWWDSIFIRVAKNSPETQSSLERSVALRSHMHSSRTPHPESKCNFYGNNFHMHDRLGWWLRCSNICKIDHGRKELQSWTILLGKSKKANLLGGCVMDLLYLLRFPSPNILSDHLEYFQLCTCCSGCGSWYHIALVGSRCQKMV